MTAHLYNTFARMSQSFFTAYEDDCFRNSDRVAVGRFVQLVQQRHEGSFFLVILQTHDVLGDRLVVSKQLRVGA